MDFLWAVHFMALYTPMPPLGFSAVGQFHQAHTLQSHTIQMSKN
jgi:hypothetical protein